MSIKVTCIHSHPILPHTAPSLVIEANNSSSLLINCGSTVLETLVRDYGEEYIRKINYVYITDMLDESIGSLRAFIKYRYDKFNLRTSVFHTTKALESFLSNEPLQGFNVQYRGGEFVSASAIQTSYKMSCDSNKRTSIGPFDVVYTTKGVGPFPSVGLLVRLRESCYTGWVYYSGRTKASSHIEDQIKTALSDCDEEFDNTNLLAFHAYTENDKPSRVDIACDTDLRDEYSKTFRKSLYLYGPKSITEDLIGRQWSLTSRGWEL